MAMYSLHDITNVCPKLEPADSDEGECNEDENLSNHFGSQTNTTEGFEVNNSIIHEKLSEYDKANGNTSIPERTMRDTRPYDNISISQSNDVVPEQTTVNNTSTGIFMEMPERQIRKRIHDGPSVCEQWP